MTDNTSITTEAIPGSLISKRSEGVKIGFEFEICIPKASVVTPTLPNGFSETNLSWLQGKTIRDMYKKIDEYGYSSAVRPVSDFAKFISMIFRLKQRTKRRLNLDTVDLYKLWSKQQQNEKNKFINGSEQEKSEIIWNMILDSIKKVRKIQRTNPSEDTRAEAAFSIREFIKKCKENNFDIPKIVRSRQTPIISAELLEAIQSIGYSLYLNTSYPIDTHWVSLKQTDNPNLAFTPNIGPKNYDKYENFLKQNLGTLDLYELLNDQLDLRARRSGTNFTKDKLLRILWVYTQPNVNPHGEQAPDNDSEGQYSRKMRKWLKMQLENLYGTVEVFDSYHQRSKKLDRWYIEPDGSLRPNSNDYSAEVVGPPQGVVESMESLKKFYAWAKENNIYTNSSTGLHINISVPAELDVLKLALFSGDKYALAKFGRMGSTYARSIINTLQSRGDVQRFLKDVDSPENQKELLRIASSVASDHFSSVNFTSSGYVSFRQAGNNYLDNLEGVLIVIRNFVRAMIIASNPDIGREEYLSKLSSLSTATAKSSTSLLNIRKAIKDNGIPLITTQIAVVEQGLEDPEHIIQRINQYVRRFEETFIDVQIEVVSLENGDNWKQQFLEAGGLLSATVATIEGLSPDRFWILRVMPKNFQSILSLSKPNFDPNYRNAFAVRDSYNTRFAIGRHAVEMIKTDNPLFSGMFRKLQLAYQSNLRLPLPESKIMLGLKQVRLYS